MGNKEDVFGLIQDHPEGLDDDDISQLTGITPRQQVQQLCNQLAATSRIRRESVEKTGKRRKIHNFPMEKLPESGNWKRRLAALIAATGLSEEEVLDQALHLLALQILRNASEAE